MKKPKVLYHATYRPLVELIKKEGLGGKSSKPNWPDSKKGVTYWSIDPDIAISYAETTEDVDEEWLNQIVVFSCDIGDFDLKKLFVNKNVQDNDNIMFEYYAIMPFNKLKEMSE